MLDSRSEYEWMAQAEESLWWYRSLHHLVADALAAHPAGTGLRILDAGCGTGGLMQFLSRRGFRHLEGIDLSPWAIKTCHARRLQARIDDLQELRTANGRWDAIICNDALSYMSLEKCATVVRSLAERLDSGGLLIINLPAFACLGGRHDEAVGTVHRFRPEELRSLMHSAGLKRQELRCWPFLLSPAILATRLADRAAACLGYRGVRPEFRRPPRWLNECLTRMVHWEIRLMSHPPFGSSVFGVAQKAP